MNGIHDMGGMQGYAGLTQYERGEPVFHERWEARLFALVRAMARLAQMWSIDVARYQRDLIPPVEYLRMSYYERWLAGLVELMVKTNLASPRPRSIWVNRRRGHQSQFHRLRWTKCCRFGSRKASPASRDAPSVARFTAGQPVRARNMNPVTHTRLPRYARGKSGTVVRDYGVFVFPDTSAVFLGESPQHLYSVRFSARELWGEQASRLDSVYVDMWDNYLEPA